MKKVFLIIGVICIAATLAFAFIYPKVMIVDADGDVLDINSNGSLTVKGA